MAKLLIISPSPLGSESRQILDNAIAFVESYSEKWRSIEMVPATGPLKDLAREASADHVLLLGSRLASALPAPEGTGLTGHLMYGILRGAGGRRWIATPHPSQFSLEGEQGKGKSAVNTANLIGMTVRHLELLQWGYAGWKDPAEPVRTRLVKNAESAREWMRGLRDAKEIAIDTETRDLRRIGNQLLTVQTGWDGHTGWVLPVGHPGTPLEPDVLKKCRHFLREYLEQGDESVHVYCNAEFDLHQFYDWLKLRWYNHLIHDVQYAEFGLDENRESRTMLGFQPGEMYGLERLCQEWGMFHYSGSPVAKSDRARLASLPLTGVAVYGALDAALPWRMRKMELELARLRNEGMSHRPYTRFEDNLLLVEGRKIQQIVQMERNGLLIDQKYVASLSGPDSPFRKEQKAAEQKWNDLPEVIEANRRLMKSSNVRGTTLFGNMRTAFSISKPDHQQLLFFDVAGLTPLSFGKNGKGSVDKNFKRANRNAPIIQQYQDLEEAQKLYGTFIVGYHEILSTSPDCKDGRLRCYYNGRLLTSRLSSVKPNLQNVPSRKARAKMIKRQFITKRGRLFRKRDFSAHEVRMLGVTAGDPSMAERFHVGMKVRLSYAYKWEIPPEDVKEWNSRLDAADVHKQNYGMLYNIDPREVTKDQRGGVKTTIFATTYGKSMKALAEDLAKEDRIRLEDMLFKAERAEDHEAINRIRREMQDSEERDWLRYAEGMFDLIFDKKFRQAGLWLKKTQKNGQRTTHAMNILGGIRHLFGYLHPARHVSRACDRRGPNSAIQGPSSNLGLLGAFFTRKLAWELFESRGQSLDNLQCNAVHDCVVGSTLVPTTRGLLRIEEMADASKGDRQDVNYVVGSRYGKERAARWIHKGIRPVYEYVTEMGSSITGTDNHRMLVLQNGKHQWVRLGDLKKGMMLCLSPKKTLRTDSLSLDHVSDYQVPDWIPNGCTEPRPRTEKWKKAWLVTFTKPRVMTPSLAFAMALIISEGMLRSRGSIIVANSDRKLLEKYCEHFFSAFHVRPEIRLAVHATRRTGNKQYVAILNSKPICHLLKEMGVYADGYQNGRSPAYFKTIPWSVRRADAESQRAFMMGYLEGDGSSGYDGLTIRSSSRELIHQMHAMMIAHGYHGHIRGKRENHSVSLRSDVAQHFMNDCATYQVSRRSVFRETRRKNGIPARYCNRIMLERFIGDGWYLDDCGRRVHPDITGYPTSMTNWSKRSYIPYDDPNKFGFMDALKMVSRSAYDDLTECLRQGYTYTPVINKIYQGEQDVFDLTIRDGEPAYVANGMICHNSTENETSIVQIPLMNYLEHHGFTTMNHRFLRDVMGRPANVGLETDVEVGATLAVMKKADRWDSEVQAIRAGIEWGNKELGWDLPTERLMRAVEHNARIIHKLRREEIRRQLEGGYATSYFMAMTPKNALKLGLIFEVDVGEAEVKVETKRTSRSPPPTTMEADWRKEVRT